MSLALYLGHGSYKPVHAVGLDQVVSSRTGVVVSCCSGLHPEETLQSEAQGRASSSKSGYGSEASSSENNRSLREQLRSLNLESMSKKDIGARLASNRLENVEVPVKNSSHSSRLPKNGVAGGASSNSGVVGRVLEL